MLQINHMPLPADTRARLKDIKSKVLLGMHVTKEERQWVLNTVAQAQTPIPRAIVQAAANEGLSTEGIIVLETA